MNQRLLKGTVALAICGAVTLTGVAPAGTRANTRVTIQSDSGDFSGYVYGPMPEECSDGRNIILFKQRGSEQDPSTDRRVANDTASLNGDKYQWNTGNTGLNGKFYAKARRTPVCKGDTSRTIHS